MRSRIAIFEGYGAPFRGTRRMGGPIFNNPRRPALSLGHMGRRAYSVPAERYISSDSRGGYGPARKPRRGYKVKRMRDTPAMKRAQKRFAKAAKKCSRRSARASFQTCMRRELRKKSKR
jgi:hypothetical protein